MNKTSYKKLNLPNANETNWWSQINDNFITIDDALAIIDNSIQNKIKQGSYNLVSESMVLIGTTRLTADTNGAATGGVEFALKGDFTGVEQDYSNVSCSATFYMSDGNQFVPCFLNHTLTFNYDGTNLKFIVSVAIEENVLQPNEQVQCTITCCIFYGTEINDDDEASSS